MLSFEEYSKRDALELAGLVRAGEITAPELMDTALAAIGTRGAELNAVVIRDDALARTEAAAAPTDTPFAGVPFLPKDINVAVAGWPMTYASRYFADVPPADKDSVLAARWRKAGLVVAGRTNMPEFAAEFVCEPELYGPTRNPWNLGRTPGGSSGGAAAAVAAGLVPMAHASDSGGSIRVPAACCGIFGFKPTSGLVATGASIGPLVNGLNCDHVVTRTVRDSAALLDLTAGPEPGMSTAFAAPATQFLDAAGRPPRRLRIGLCPQAPCGHNATAEITDHLQEAGALLAEMGHDVEEWSWPTGCDPYEPASVLWTEEIAFFFDQRRTELGRPPSDDELGRIIHLALEQAARIDGLQRVRMQQAAWDIRRRVAQAMRDTDVLMTPVIAEPPLTTGLLSNIRGLDLDAWHKRSNNFAPFTEIFNMTGQPAMSVPLFRTSDGMPLGIQFAGRVGEDCTLMALAGELERRHPWPHLGQIDDGRVTASAIAQTPLCRDSNVSTRGR